MRAAVRSDGRLAHRREEERERGRGGMVGGGREQRV